MADKPKPPAPSNPLNEGYEPLKKGWAPKVQGGFKPGPDASPKTPSGGSGVKPLPPKK